MKVDQVLPALFIRGGFWDHKPAAKFATLHGLGIDVVVCTINRTDPDLLAAPALTYYHRPLPDGARVDPAFDVVAAYVVEEIRRGRKVLVHCRAGRNRSGLVVGLAVRQLLRVSGQAAYDRVKVARPGTFANPAYADYLRQLPPPPAVVRTPARARVSL